MAIIIPAENVRLNEGYGQAVNKALKNYIEPELRRRGVVNFASAGIEILPSGKYKVYFDDQVLIEVAFKTRKIKPENVGKETSLDITDIKDVRWSRSGLSPSSAKILVIHYNNNWWIWNADFLGNKRLENEFKFMTTHKVRLSGYLPLKNRLQGKKDFFDGWGSGLNKELPAMWRRYVTISQRYSGVMAYDGNYFDLFSHAQEFYVLGFYYSSIIVCRTATEQALIRIMLKVGKAFDIYKNTKSKKLKSIEELAESCRSYSLFRGKYPISKAAARKVNKISVIASNLSHPKTDLQQINSYKQDALICMDGLQFVIKHHLNFVKDTGVVSGYKKMGIAKRLK